MNQHIEFNTPTPKPWLMKLMAPVTQSLFLQGLPVLRDLPFVNRMPGIRGLAKVRHIDFPRQDQLALKKLTGENKAVFFLPNHPEFFTDWMLDKYILARVAPDAACWASASIVNGMGSLMQSFWLNNNLIAQIPGQSDKGKNYAVKTALKGNGVLLHPEGKVSWLGNTVAPLFGGAIDMAANALNKGLRSSSTFQSWLAPIVWKLRFDDDVHCKLLEECRYVEKRLELNQSESKCAAKRTYGIYYQLALRDYRSITQQNIFPSAIHLIELRKRIIYHSYTALVDQLYIEDSGAENVLREVRKWLNTNRTKGDEYNNVRRTYNVYQRWSNLDECVFADSMLSQEEIAEHLKRIRSHYCKGTLTDTLNKYIPQAAGGRTAFIRAVNPIAFHEYTTNNKIPDTVCTMNKVRHSMQVALNKLNDEIEIKRPALRVNNPFYC